MTDRLDLPQGTLDLLILKALSWGPRHGYAVVEWIQDATDAAFLIGEGTLYPALHRLERRGWIASEWGVSDNKRKAKFYRLTEVGHKQVHDEAREWERTTAILARFLTPREQS